MYQFQRVLNMKFGALVEKKRQQHNHAVCVLESRTNNVWLVGERMLDD